VYWRRVKRGNTQFHCCTFLETRNQIIKMWGTSGLAFCDPVTGNAVVRMETKLPG
jgi:hypothetical protein